MSNRTSKITIQEAYDEWSQQDGSKEFAIKTRNVFKNTWKHLDMNMPCSEVTLAKLHEACNQASGLPADKIKAASVMVHVLRYAHTQDPADCPLPSFEYSDITTGMFETVKTGTKLRKEALKVQKSAIKVQNTTDLERKELKLERETLKSEHETPETKPTKTEISKPKVERKRAEKETSKPKKSKAPQNGNIRLTKDGKRYNPSRERRQIAQIDPSTMEVIKVWPTLREPERALRVTSLWRAIANRRPSGGYYWCDFGDIDTFEPSESRKNPVICHKPVTISKNVEFVAPPTKPKKEETPADGVHIGNVPEQNPALSDCTDKALIDELKYRGWHGHIHLTIDVYL